MIFHHKTLKEKTIKGEDEQNDEMFKYVPRRTDYDDDDKKMMKVISRILLEKLFYPVKVSYQYQGIFKIAFVLTNFYNIFISFYIVLFSCFDPRPNISFYSSSLPTLSSSSSLSQNIVTLKDQREDQTR